KRRARQRAPAQGQGLHRNSPAQGEDRRPNHSPANCDQATLKGRRPRLFPGARTAMSKVAVPYSGATSGASARDEITKILRRFGCSNVGFMDDYERHEVL